MKEIIKKTFLLGLGAATLTKNQAEKIVKGLVKKNAVTIKEGRDMINKIKKAAKSESNRVRKFVGQEAKRVAGTVGGISKIQLGKVKKRLNSINKELSGKGKKTLKGILKQLSR